jgi:hypothetical protein
MKFVKILSEEFSTVLIPLADIKKFEVESLNEEFENLEKEGGLLFAKRVKINTPYEVFILEPAKLRLTKRLFKEVAEKVDEESDDDLFDLLGKDKRFCAAQEASLGEAEKLEQEFEKFLESEAKLLDLAKVHNEFDKMKI